MRSWYALEVKTNHEQAIQASPYASNIEFFHATYPEESRKGNSRVTIQRPLFPGYLFARFDVMESAAAIAAIAGVFGIVRFDGEPAAIPDDQIESVRKLLASDRTVTPCPFLSLKKGEVVEVKYGALAGARGVILAPKGKTHALFVVSIEMLGRSVATTLPVEQLKKAA